MFFLWLLPIMGDHGSYAGPAEPGILKSSIGCPVDSRGKVPFRWTGKARGHTTYNMDNLTTLAEFGIISASFYQQVLCNT